MVSLPCADALAGELHGVDRMQDADVQAGGVVVLQVGLHLGDDLGVVGAVLVQPEDGRGAGDAGTGDGQLHPVLDRRVLGLAGAEDVARLDLLRRAGSCRRRPRRGWCRLPGAKKVLSWEPYSSAFWAMRPTLGTLPDGGGVEGAVLLAVLDDGLVHRGVAAVWDHRERVVQLAVGAPHLAGVAHHHGHGGVHDDVVGHVQVGDALVGIHHGEGRAGRRRRP